MEAKKAKFALKQLRESITGILELIAAGEEHKECIPYGILGANVAIRVLDLFLTGELHARNSRRDLSILSLFMSDFKTRLIPLSTTFAHLTITASLEDPVQLTFTEDAPVDLRRKWMLIRHAEESQAKSLLPDATSKPMN